MPYAAWTDVWTDMPAAVGRLAAHPDVVRMCDLGGGANPILSLAEISEHGLSYEIVDAAQAELEKAPSGYATVHANALDPELARTHGPYDVVASRFIAEHVPDPASFHRNVRALLRPGGYAVHMFPTLYEPVFVANRLMPDRLADVALRRVQEGREAEGANAKFRAYYRWCRGPTRRQVRRLRALGFDIVEYTGYFGHGYFRAVKPLDALVQQLGEALVRRPVASLTSYAIVILRRQA